VSQVRPPDRSQVANTGYRRRFGELKKPRSKGHVRKNLFFVSLASWQLAALVQHTVSILANPIKIVNRQLENSNFCYGIFTPWPPHVNRSPARYMLGKNKKPGVFLADRSITRVCGCMSAPPGRICFTI
jgi:hypothetical protein